MKSIWSFYFPGSGSVFIKSLDQCGSTSLVCSIVLNHLQIFANVKFAKIAAYISNFCEQCRKDLPTMLQQLQTIPKILPTTYTLFCGRYCKLLRILTQTMTGDLFGGYNDKRKERKFDFQEVNDKTYLVAKVILR